MSPTQDYKGRKVLVTGGTGMVGRPLVKMLLEQGAHVRVASLDTPINIPSSVDFVRADLTQSSECMRVCKNIEDVFHLAGVKGGIGLGHSKSAQFFVLNTVMSICMLEAARVSGVERYLYTSTIGVYPEAEVYKEEEMWKGLPHSADRYGGWSKRIGELQCEAYSEQFDIQIAIVRPANIYGPYDNFDPSTAMAVGALVYRIVSGENPLFVWGNGQAARDFIYAEDCAFGMLKAMLYGKCDPINLGTGTKTTISDVVHMICKAAKVEPEIVWDATQPTGNSVRLMDVRKATKLIGFIWKTDFETGIKKTVDWYKENRSFGEHRYQPFDDDSLLEPKR